MNLGRFLADRQPAWSELEALVRAGARRPDRLGAEGVRRLGWLYRSAVADLALARRSFPGDPAVTELEDLVGRARHLVYAAPARRLSVARFFSTTYWQRVRERPAPLAVAAGLLVLPAALAGAWAVVDPASASGLVPEEFRAVTEPRPEGGPGLSPGARAAFSSAVLTNNIRVSFFAFAGGMALGLLTAYVVLLNGTLLGVVGGLLVGAGQGDTLAELVAPHGVLELSCIVVSGAAGLRLGWAAVDPGRRRRAESVVDEARRAAELALGTAPWLVVAGLVEGFVASAALGPAPGLTIGLALGGVYWCLVAWRGRPLTAGPGPSSRGRR